MIRLFILTTTLVLYALWQGWFTTRARSSTDFLFTPQPERETRIAVVGIDDASLAAIGRWPWPRATQTTLLERIARTNPMVIGYDVLTDDPVPEADTGALAEVFASHAMIVAPTDSSRVWVTTDGDGIVRSIPCPDSFALAIAQRVRPGASCPDRQLLIAYALTQSNVEYLAAKDVLTGQARPQNPIVLIGATSPSLHDERQTPLLPSPMPGVILHANALATLLAPTPLRRLEMLPRIALTITALVLFFWGLQRVRLAWGAVWLLAWLGSVLLADIWLFGKGVLLDYFYLPVGLIITYGTQLGYGYYDQYRKRVFVMEAFGKYLSPVVVDQLIKTPGRLRQGGDTRLLTMLFTDIRSFTTIAERMDPDDLVILLNRYLTFATSVIHRHGGTIDKFVGDAVIAFWNAPLEDPAHASHAAQAALELHRGVGQFDGIAIGIGIHTDTVLVGNIGARDRLNYTMIGDGVNTTSRLEGLTKLYGAPIIVSEAFVGAVDQSPTGAAFLFRTLDRVRVKGKQQPLTVFELVGPAAEVAAKTRSVIHAYEQALAWYQKGAWSKAKKLALKMLTNHADAPSRFLADRCKRSAPRHWDGVYELPVK